jgi:hypothetical protein
MTHTTPTKSALIAAFFFGAATGLVAQSPANNVEPTKPELVALNTKTVPYPAATASIVTNSQPQSPASAKDASPQVTAPKESAARSEAINLIRKTMLPGAYTAAPSTFTTAPGTYTVAKVDDQPASRHSSSGSSWFTAGPQAFPVPVRTDLAFGLPVSQYGAGATAVEFNFGKK